MDKIVFSDEISKDKLLELTANKVQELVEGYNEVIKRLDKRDEGIREMVKRIKHDLYDEK